MQVNTTEKKKTYTIFMLSEKSNFIQIDLNYKSYEYAFAKILVIYLGQ